jgi:hypothetical protein
VNAKQSTVGNPDQEAARVAVLVARSAVTERGAVQPTTYRLQQAREFLSATEAAHHLAKLPKPLRLSSSLEGSCVVLTVAPLHDDAHAVRGHASRMLVRGNEHPLEYVAKRFPGDPDALMATCHGAGELVQVTGRALANWERDYYHENGPDGGGWDFADSRYAANRGIRLGTSDGPGFVDFGWAIDDAPRGIGQGT